ncbi:MAG: hypothetical protein WBA12_14695, partial [Catalinimonas sp.]
MTHHLSALRRLCLWGSLLLAVPAAAQQEGVDDLFDPSQYEAADDSKIRAYCNNKVANLSPTNLLSVSYDVVTPFDLRSRAANDGEEITTPMGI